jgi:signal transduction histidine kinase
LSIGKVIADVIRMMHEQAASRGIELIRELPAGEFSVCADQRAIKQVFLNLLSNAIKFSKQGGKVSIRVIADRPDSAMVQFEDRGIGMNEEELKRALQPFGQAKPATTRDYGGTGLGLPITKGLVEAHGGRLAIDSEAGFGTVVTVILPIDGTALVPSP